ncbi:hypothetical protein ACWKWP_12345 [Agromyces soli]
MSGQFPTDLEFDRMRQNLVGNANAWERKNARTRKIAAIAAIGAVALVGAGVAWVALASPELRENAVYCYSDADQSSKFSTVVRGEAEVPDGSLPVADAIELCEAAWRAGAVGQPAPPPPDGDFPVPPLQACVRLDGVTAVFPSDGSSTDEFCRDLGLRVK